jgi:hypothetical protein
MTGVITVAAVALVMLHMIDGRIVLINPRQVTQLLSTPPQGGANKVLADAVQCVIRLADGSFTSVAEDCDTVRKLMEGKP